MKLFNGMNKIVILISFAIIIASCGTSGSEATSASKEAETAVATDTIAVDSTKVDRS